MKIDLDELAIAVNEAAPEEAALGPPVAKKLGELVLPGENDPTELLKFRYLCRGGGLLLVGPTGIGKSSLSMQAMILWALARELFGIQPARPLKSMVVQAENDEGDLAEMRDGVIRGLGLSAEDAARACDSVIVVREDSRSGMAFVQTVLRPLMEAHRPDLLWIDPALAYLGGESSSQKDVGGFLRNMLNPLLHEFGCGCVVVHHTNKPATGKEKPDWQGSDFAYLGSGSIEWANWARAVLALRSVGSHSVYELHAGKRGGRLRWREEDGEEKCYKKHIAHAKEDGAICWREAEADELPSGPREKRKWTKEDLLPHVPTAEPIAKRALVDKAQSKGIPLRKIDALLDELIAEKTVYLWRLPRPRTNPLVCVSRHPQPEEDLVQ